MQQNKLLASAFVMTVTASVLLTQGAPAPSRSRPAPQVTGRLIETDGARRLTLEYRNSAESGTFTGTIHSTCMLPAPSKPGETRPLDLSAIPVGTPLTVFYVPRGQTGKPGSRTGNVILALRFGPVGHGSPLPTGVVVPCFRASAAPVR